MWKQKSKFYFPDRTQPHPWGLTTGTLHNAEITSFRNNRLTENWTAENHCFYLDSCKYLYACFLFIYYLLLFVCFFCLFPRVVCFHDHLLTPSLHWAWLKHRRVWLGSSRQKWLIWSSFSDIFKWIFRITVTRNGQLNLHKLLARAVVDLGKWYPYLVASTMWDPQRKKDFLMRRVSPCLHYTKFCLFCKKSKKPLNKTPFLVQMIFFT